VFQLQVELNHRDCSVSRTPGRPLALPVVAEAPGQDFMLESLPLAVTRTLSESDCRSLNLKFNFKLKCHCLVVLPYGRGVPTLKPVWHFKFKFAPSPSPEAILGY
jgi:hypothetical protein